MRKTLTREITHTTVKLAKMEVKEGKVQAVELPDEVLLGNVSKEKAQKRMTKKYGQVTVFEVHPNTKKYQMPVERFLELAEEVVEEEQDEQ